MMNKYLAIALFLTISHISAYVYGRFDAVSKIEVSTVKQENKDIKNAVENSEVLAKDFTGSERNKDETLQKLDIDSRNLYAKFGGLRVSSKCANEDKAAGTAHSGDGTNKAGTDRIATGGIDLAGIAQEVIRLGEDLDKADAEKTQLQEIVKSLHDVCVMPTD